MDRRRCGRCWMRLGRLAGWGGQACAETRADHSVCWRPDCVLDPLLIIAEAEIDGAVTLITRAMDDSWVEIWGSAQRRS
jgi:hypothetical protein